MLLRIALTLIAIATPYAHAEGDATPDALGKQFDAQVARLVERGYPKLFGDRAIFDEEMSRLRKEAVAYMPAKPDYTFLIVIPENHGPINWQLRQIVLPSGKTIACAERHIIYRDRTELRNNGEFITPREPYLLRDVSIGDDTLKRLAWDVLPELERAGRRGLTFMECIALCVQHPEILTTKQIVAAGTIAIDHNHPKPTEQFIHWQIDATSSFHTLLDTPRVNLALWTTHNQPGSWWIANYQFPSCIMEEHK